MEDLVLKTLDAGPMYLYVLELPVEEEGVAGFKKADGATLLGRKHGILVAVRLGFLLQSALDRGLLASEHGTRMQMYPAAPSPQQVQQKHLASPFPRQLQKPNPAAPLPRHLQQK